MSYRWTTYLLQPFVVTARTLRILNHKDKLKGFVFIYKMTKASSRGGPKGKKRVFLLNKKHNNNNNRGKNRGEEKSRIEISLYDLYVIFFLSFLGVDLST